MRMLGSIRGRGAPGPLLLAVVVTAAPLPSAPAAAASMARGVARRMTARALGVVPRQRFVQAPGGGPGRTFRLVGTRRARAVRTGTRRRPAEPRGGVPDAGVPRSRVARAGGRAGVALLLRTALRIGAAVVPGGPGTLRKVGKGIRQRVRAARVTGPCAARTVVVVGLVRHASPRSCRQPHRAHGRRGHATWSRIVIT